MQRLDVLPGRRHAGENIAQVDLHGVAFVRGAKKFDLFQFALERRKEGQKLLLRRRRGFLRHCEWQRAAGCRLEPLIGNDHHRLREIERGESRIDRQREYAVGERDLVVLQAVALAAEDDGDGIAQSDARRHQCRRLRRADDRLGLVMGARGRGQDKRAVGNRRWQAVVKFGAVENSVGASRHHPRFVVRPRLARRDQPQARQAEIGHGASGRADILAKLRLDQNDNRAGGSDPILGLVGSCTGHLSSGPRYSENTCERQRLLSAFSAAARML